MILRLASALALILGTTLFVLYLHLVGKGPWVDPAARHLRAMKDRIAEPDSLEPVSLDAMAELPRRLPLAQYAKIEDRAIVVDGYVQRMVRATDGDYHLEVAPTADGPEGAPVPYVTAEITEPWRQSFTAWTFERLLAAFRPMRGSPAEWAQGPRRARIGGWLLYDFPFEGEVPKPGHPPRLSRWEIHPVTYVALWDDSLGTYTELPQ